MSCISISDIDWGGTLEKVDSIDFGLGFTGQFHMGFESKTNSCIACYAMSIRYTG